MHRLFDELEFRVLRERLFATLQSAEPEAEGGIEVQGGAIEPGARAGLARRARPRRRAGSGWPSTASPAAPPPATSRASGWPRASRPSRRGRPGRPPACRRRPTSSVAALTPDDEAALGEWLADPAVPKAAHDAKAALHALRGRGWTLARAHQRHRARRLPGPARASAASTSPTSRCATCAASCAPSGEAEGGQLSLLGGEEEADAARASAQMVAASAVAELADALDAELAEQRRHRAARRAGAAAAVRAGRPGDGRHRGRPRRAGRAGGASSAAQVKQAAQDAYAVIGKEINLGSPKQLQVVLFDELSMPKTKRTKTGYTTDADALQTLFEQTGHEFLSHLLVHRDATRLKITVEGLLKSVADDGRIHTTYSQTIAATGRLSSTEPNLQNVPIRTAAGRADPRDVRRRRPGYARADDRRLQPDRDADHGAPVRGRRADRGVPVAARLPRRDRRPGVRRSSRPRSPPAQRAKIKAMNYGLAYGLSAFGLSNQLRISTEEARGLMDDYFDGFGGVRDYLRSVVDMARKDGYTATILGRRRYLPDLTSDNRQRREMAERMALNAPIQGSAADIIKVAMLGVHRALAGRGPAQPDAAAGARRAGARGAPRASGSGGGAGAPGDGRGRAADVPLEVSVGYGRSWDDAAH